MSWAGCQGAATGGLGDRALDRARHRPLTRGCLELGVGATGAQRLALGVLFRPDVEKQRGQGGPVRGHVEFADFGIDGCVRDGEGSLAAQVKRAGAG
jgi:hypothetical protein